MSFRKPITTCYNLNDIHFTGGIMATSLKGPKGKRGYLIDVGIRVTETFACDTTTAKIRLGTTSDPDEYAELIIPDGTAVTDFFNVADDRDAIKGEKLPEETQIEITFVNSADTGVVAGRGDVYIVIDWY